MVKSYRHRQILNVVEALQYTGINYDEMKAFAGKNCFFMIHEDDSREDYIVSIAGYYTKLNRGDYVVKEKDGYCIHGPGVFKEIYAEVE